MLRLRSLVALVLVVAASIASAQELDHEFVYQPEGNPSHVSVAGDFNNWSRDANPMTKGDDGAWRARVKLQEGVQYYKFVVDGDHWKSDPKSDKSLDVADNHGGVNSGVFIGDDGRKLPPVKDNAILAKAVKHDAKDPRDSSVFAPGSLLLLVRTQANDVKSVTATIADGDKSMTLPLFKVGTRFGYDRWGNVATGLKSDDITYSFELIDGTAK